MELRDLGFSRRPAQLNIVSRNSAGIGGRLRKGESRGFCGGASGAFSLQEGASRTSLGRRGVKSDPDFLRAARPAPSAAANVAQPEPANGRRGAPGAGPARGRGLRLSLSGEE